MGRRAALQRCALRSDEQDPPVLELHDLDEGSQNNPGIRSENTDLRPAPRAIATDLDAFGFESLRPTIVRLFLHEYKRRTRSTEGPYARWIADLLRFGERCE